MGKSNFKIAIKYGIIALISMIIINVVDFTFRSYILPNQSLRKLIAIFVLFLPVFLARRAAIITRKENDGYLSFTSAFVIIYFVFVFFLIGDFISFFSIGRFFESQPKNISTGDIAIITFKRLPPVLIFDFIISLIAAWIIKRPHIEVKEVPVI